MDVREFLNSKSMLTPGVAGGIVMLITNALQAQFEMPAKWVALALSFVIGALVFADAATHLLPRIILYVLNALIIFAIAVGTNTAGTAARQDDGSTMFPSNVQQERFFHPWFDT